MTLLENQDREWLNSKIEAYVDGDLLPQDKQRFEALLDAERAMWEEVHLASQISSSLRAIPDEICPDRVLVNVMAHVRQDIRQSIWTHIQRFFLNLNVAHLKPALAVVVLFLVVITSTQIGKPTENPSMEVAQALNDVKWTLAFLSEAGRSTAATVKTDVIEDQMVGPMSRNFPTKLEN